VLLDDLWTEELVLVACLTSPLEDGFFSDEDEWDFELE
jgi:adenosyl cobinamide kinase/adenosyl cobinamide phosphate guanylyltransferase